MRRLLMTLLTAAALNAPVASAAPLQWQPAQLSQSVQRDLQSRITDTRYRLFVSAPSTPAPAAGWPVLYVLDGNALFPALATQARAADLRAERSGAEPVLVVGIGYPVEGLYDMPARAQDYTPSPRHTEVEPDRQRDADDFARVIEEEIKPLIAAQYSVDQSRQTLFGHSYGGLFTLHVLLHSPASFSGYVAASPSIWWDQHSLLEAVPSFVGNTEGQPRKPRLLLSVGLAEEPSADAGGDQRTALLRQRRMVSNVKALFTQLQPLTGKKLDSELLLIAGADHGASALVTSLRVLDFAVQPTSP